MASTMEVLQQHYSIITNKKYAFMQSLCSSNVRRPKVVTSVHFSVRPIVTAVVIYECAFLEARRIILEVNTIQNSDIFIQKTYNNVLFMEEG